MAEARLYLCCDARERQGDLPEFLDAVLANGVDIVQLRQKGMEARQELAALEVFDDACRRHGALLAVNDRADIAVGAASDVLHLGQDDLPVPLARAIVGAGPVVGRSCHAEAEVDEAAAADGVDYFCTGPVWPTPTKPGRFAPGLGLVAHAARLAPPFAPGSRPWFAIGGIDAGTLPEVVEAGARRVVVVRAVTEAEDPGAAAAELAGLLRG
ncbi:thiamine phosphate synthase [Catenulispora yoronensis]|uniref:thiamine phosphate synthase n=1 Tax=Catenulispora yoronensis TaxID=450799 RepID=UPI0031D1AF19